jgi:DNA repair protein RadA/Sms
VSSVKGKELKLEKPLIIGEVGLTAEVRPIAFCDRLVNEGIKMGFKNVVMPFRNKDKVLVKGANVILVSSLKEAISKVF